jgi:hypothetical protein
LINENGVKMHLIIQPVAMIHRKGPKSASQFKVKSKFFIKRITIILTEAVEARCDGQMNRLSIFRGIPVISFTSEE